MTKKYKINADGRVVALRDFGDVKVGDVMAQAREHWGTKHPKHEEGLGSLNQKPIWSR